MSNETRDELVEGVVHEIRSFQNAVDWFDQAASEALGLNRTDQRCVDLLSFRGPMTAGQLAETSGMSTGAVTAIIDRLERSGFVERYRDEADRRRIHIRVTDEGFRRGWAVYAPLGEEGTTQLAQYTDDELRLVRDFLNEGAELNRRHAALLRERLAAGFDPASPGHPLPPPFAGGP